MTDEIDPIDWAARESQRLRMFNTSGYGAHDLATAGDLAPGIEFLRRFAGPRSAFTQAAEAIQALGPGEAFYQPPALADLLDRWSDWFRSGLQDAQPYEVRARVTAATDLMELVSDMLAERATHPAAPIVLTGAALEERLRAVAEGADLTIAGRGLDAYGAELKKADLISPQEAKQVTAWAGLRNRAAHGEDLGELRIEEARIMADGVNLFLQRHEPPTLPSV
jgi:hypothetical protein